MTRSYSCSSMKGLSIILTLAPFNHDPLVFFFFNERFVDHFDHRVAAEDALGGHQVVKLHSKLESKQNKYIFYVVLSKLFNHPLWFIFLTLHITAGI